jgi:hypothetical protein
VGTVPQLETSVNFVGLMGYNRKWSRPRFDKLSMRENREPLILSLSKRERA